MPSIDQIADTFQAVDEELRLQLLLDYARRLPALPPELAAVDTDESRVPECMTPVWLWVLPENGHVRVHAKVAEEAPTVQGFLSIIIHSYDNATAEELAEIPTDLLNRLGISNAIRMNRAVGLSAIIRRVANEARKILNTRQNA